jgi:phospholipid/cholesterol/gamma-HCH transport system substrate-binding protein
VKRFSERNPFVIAVVGTALLAAISLGAINFSKLPLINDHTGYGAAFADSAGLAQGDPVAISGVDVGNVTGLSLSGSHVLVRFTVQDGVRLGLRTSAAAKVLTPLGQEYLNIAPTGPGAMASGSVIPEHRTAETKTIISTIEDGASTIGKVNIAQLRQALATTDQTLQSIPASATASMLNGLAQLSSVIGTRSSKLHQLVDNVATLSKTLADHGNQIFTLIGQSDLVLQVLTQRHQAIAQLLQSTASLTTQLESLIAAHQSQMTPLVNDLQTVSAVLAKDSGDLAQAIPLLASANKYLANVTGSGEFGDFVLPTALIPDNVIAECAKAGAIKPGTGCDG